MNRNRSHALPTLIAAVAAAFTLAACNKADDGRTAGQKVDSAVAQVEQKAAEVKSDVKAAGEAAKDATASTVDAMADKTKDAAITAAVNAELAKDSKLSALQINVDTAGGRVALHGSAPDAASRDRATALARAVDGVKTVDNQLSIKPKS